MNFLAAYALFGAAALHRSASELSEPGAERLTRMSPAQLGALAGASLIAPAVLAVQIAQGAVTEGVAIVIGSVVLFTLVVTRMAQLVRQVEAQARRLSELAALDDLTGLPNRRTWTAELHRAIERSRRDENPLSIALLDLDHFKRFNDEFGHGVGDQVLRLMAKVLREQVREIDLPSRYGGEELIVVMPSADLAACAAIAERIRRSIAECKMTRRSTGEALPGITVSIGVAQFQGGESMADLIDRCDQALYLAKKMGRNRVVTETELEGAQATA
jgi:diguanylate cyclase